MRKSRYAHHTSLALKDFTVFQDFEISFKPGLNVILGGNGTGKTHLLKVLYSLDSVRSHWRDIGEEKTEGPYGVWLGNVWKRQLQSTFLPEKFEDIYRRGQAACTVTAEWADGTKFRISLSEQGANVANTALDMEVVAPVFIPSKDILGHSRGFLSLYSLREIDFDQTYFDLLNAAYLNPLREKANSKLLKIIEKIIGGRVVNRGERFYIEAPKGGGRTELHMVAEGWRKLALLYLLIENGSLAPGRILLWDEPEANLNPAYMDEVIEIVLTLARAGTQVILTTHDYVILKEIDLRATAKDDVAYFALEATENGTVARTADDFASLNPNLILDQFDSLLVRDLQRADAIASPGDEG